MIVSPELAGPLVTVGEGAIGGVAWRLEVADASDGTRCVSVVTNPPLDGDVVLITPGGAITSVRTPAGSTPSPSCGPSPGVGNRSDVGIAGLLLLTVGGRDGDVHYAGLLEEGVEATLVLVDGQELDVESVEGVFIVVREGPSWPERVVVDGRHRCQLSGTDSVSGRDAIC